MISWSRWTARGQPVDLVVALERRHAVTRRAEQRGERLADRAEADDRDVDVGVRVRGHAGTACGHRTGEDLRQRLRRARPPGRRRAPRLRQATKRSGRTRIAPSAPISRWRSHVQRGSNRSPSTWPMRTASSGMPALGGEVARGRAPGLAVLAGDQQEAPGRDQVLDRAPAAVLVVDPGVRQRRARTRRRLVDADLVRVLRGRAAVGHDRGGLVGVAVLDVELVELHRLRADRPQHGGAVLGVLGQAAPQAPEAREVLLLGLLVRDADRGVDDAEVVDRVLERALRVALERRAPLGLVGVEQLGLGVPVERRRRASSTGCGRRGSRSSGRGRRSAGGGGRRRRRGRRGPRCSGRPSPPRPTSA